MTASGQDSAPRNSLRGSTRGTGEWHIYTAIYDERKSEMFVDGYCEASAKNVGNNKLDGLSMALLSIEMMVRRVAAALKILATNIIAARCGLS